jgi:hypothetical protein
VTDTPTRLPERPTPTEADVERAKATTDIAMLGGMVNDLKARLVESNARLAATERALGDALTRLAAP